VSADGSCTRGRNVDAATIVLEFRPSSPHVMLSPNARKRVRVRLGGAVTVTLNPHVAVRPAWSVTVQVTAVEPTWNVEPLGGAQVSVVGAVPPVTVAGGYGTGNGAPDGDVTDTGAGHARDGAATAGGVTIGGVGEAGCAGVSEHAASINGPGSARNTSKTARLKPRTLFTRASTTVELRRKKGQEGDA